MMRPLKSSKSLSPKEEDEDEDGALMSDLNANGAFLTIGTGGTALAAALARLCHAILCSLVTP